MSAPVEQTFSAPPAVEATYKSREVESLIDIHFYRPVGYQLALRLAKLRLTPTQVTAMGAVFGLTAGHLYGYSNLPLNLLGVLLHVVANAFDNADGQLARMTSTGTRLGRMNDSFADHVIFINIYIHLALRCLHEGASPTMVLLALGAGVSHTWQGAIADFVRNAYLHFSSGGVKGDFESSGTVRAQYAQLTWNTEPWHKILLLMYASFTAQQESLMPSLVRLRDAVATRESGIIPEWLARQFRRQTEPLLPWVNLIMTNPRMILLLLVLLVGQPAWFFIAQLTLFNLLAACLLFRFARICSGFVAQINSPAAAQPA